MRGWAPTCVPLARASGWRGTVSWSWAAWLIWALQCPLPGAGEDATFPVVGLGEAQGAEPWHTPSHLIRPPKGHPAEPGAGRTARPGATSPPAADDWGPSPLSWPTYHPGGGSPPGPQPQPSCPRPLAEAGWGRGGGLISNCAGSGPGGGRGWKGWQGPGPLCPSSVVLAHDAREVAPSSPHLRLPARARSTTRSGRKGTAAPGTHRCPSFPQTRGRTQALFRCRSHKQLHLGAASHTRLRRRLWFWCVGLLFWVGFPARNPALSCSPQSSRSSDPNQNSPGNRCVSLGSPLPLSGLSRPVDFQGQQRFHSQRAGSRPGEGAQ